MKLIRCNECGDPVALSKRWRDCECRQSGGAYNADGDTATVAGPCSVYGISNKLFLGQRVEAWPYAEQNGKITRRPSNITGRGL